MQSHCNPIGGWPVPIPRAAHAKATGCPQLLRQGAPMNRYSAIALVLFAASSVHATEKTLERTFTVSPGEALIVDADSASVQVSGNNTHQVTVRMHARGAERNLA